MEPQKIEIPEPVTFKRIEFIIKEVYAGKDNDTAISEIIFFNRGERIELDFKNIFK